jgi:hypothetical protein
VKDLQKIVAPFALLRMATLPYKALDDMRLPDVERQLAQIIEIEQQLANYQQQLDTALFHSVSSIDDDAVKMRRSVLKLKRNIHNGRAANIDGQLYNEICDLLNPEDKQALADWNSAHEQLKVTTEIAEQSLVDQRQSHLRTALRAPLNETLFKRALAFASLGVAIESTREKKLPTKAKPDNFERSLFGYLTRAAAKTSPFSSFMSMTVVPFDFEQKDQTVTRWHAQDLTHQCSTRINRGISGRLFNQAALVGVKNDEVLLHVNKTFKQKDAQRYSALCDRDIVLLGRPWTENRTAIFRLHEKVSEVFTNNLDEATWSQWQQRLCDSTGATPAQVGALLDKFIRKGLLCIKPLTDTFDNEPEVTVKNYLANSQLDQLKKTAQTVEQMIELTEQISADDSDKRAVKINAIKVLETRALNHLDTQRFDRFHNTVLEDCWGSGVKGKIPANGLPDLSSLHDFIASQLIIIPEYVKLRIHFIERFGEGGQCDNVAEFLTDIGNKLVEITEYGSAVKQQKSERPPQGSQLGVTVQVQLVSPKNDSQAPLIVVNRVFDRPGWLASRFCFGESSEQQFLRENVTDWIEALCPDSEPVDLLINGQNNDLQTHPKLTKRAMCWPSQPRPGSEQDILNVDDLIIRHDADSGLLKLFEGDKPINLMYLGSTFPTVAWGISYVLTILTQPFSIGRPNFKPPVLSNAEDVIHKPRIEHDKVILSRAFSWVRSEHLMNKWFNNKGIQQLLDIKRDCIDKGLPTTFFAKPYNAPGDSGSISHKALHADRKPLWVDINNPFSLTMLERIAQKNTWLSFTEALPGPEELWLNVDGNDHVSELQIEMQITK